MKRLWEIVKKKGKEIGNRFCWPYLLIFYLFSIFRIRNAYCCNGF